MNKHQLNHKHCELSKAINNYMKAENKHEKKTEILHHDRNQKTSEDRWVGQKLTLEKEKVDKQCFQASNANNIF